MDFLQGPLALLRNTANPYFAPVSRCIADLLHIEENWENPTAQIRSMEGVGMNEQTDLENTLKRGLFEQCGFQYGPGMFGQPGVEWGYGYAPYDATDEIYYGARAVVDMEWRASLKWRHPTKDGDKQAERAARDNLTGLALSGGGIRSASFSLGVMQALAKAGWLKHIDYLSTVSGGGYIGSSFTWLLHKEWEVPGRAEARPRADTAEQDPNTPGTKSEPKTLRFGMDWDNFPYRTYPIAESVPKPNDVYSGRILRYLRQHARYLLPGGGLDWISLVAVVLRNTLFSLIVYGSLFVLVFLGLHGLSQLTGRSMVPEPCSQATLESCFAQDAAARPGAALFRLAGYTLGIWALLATGYIFLTLCFGKDWFIGKGKHTNYSWRYWYEKGFGRWPLIAALLLAILGSVPASYHWLGSQDSTPQAQAFTIEAAPLKAGEWAIEGTIRAPAGSPAPHKGMLSIVFDNLEWLAGVISTLAGVVMSLFAFKQSSTVKASRIPTGVVAALGSIALIFGFLLLAYHVYFWIGHGSHILVGVLAFILVVARFVNINYMSLHRYYRDRLMETFLPNVKDAVDVHGVVAGGAKMHESDGTKLYQMCPANTDCKPDEAKPSPKQKTGPFHIINTNIVLVSSYIPKFRGRGGDNFILTPLCCGSNATGWCETGRQQETRSGQPGCKIQGANSPFESLTFASAMAISGAAVNPNTGVGGQGITRQPLLSFLMGILNIRLGYWASNPCPRSEYLRRIEAVAAKRIARKGWRWVRLKVHQFITSCWVGSENAISPGIGELFLRRYLDENSHNIQLTDGGHFENLGLYELVRRRLKVIIVCDGAEDLNYAFCDLANAIEKVRADFGAKIEIDAADLEALIPTRGKQSGEGKDSDEVAFSPRGYLVAPIRYTQIKGEKKPRVGTLIYITTAFLKSHTADLFAYKKAHPEFPDQSTSDQFFDETQFEAYRELGFQTAHKLLCDDEVCKKYEVESIFGKPDITCPEKWRPQSGLIQPA